MRPRICPNRCRVKWLYSFLPLLNRNVTPNCFIEMSPHGDIHDEQEGSKRGIELSTGAILEVIATNEATRPGRSPTLLLIDEARDIPDEFYAAFVPSAIGAGGKVIIASMAGPPRGFFYELVQHSAEETWLHHSTTNDKG